MSTDVDSNNFAERIGIPSTPIPDMDGQAKDAVVFEIPSRSFTAFRLRYCPSVEIAACSSTLLLGGVPESWIRSHQPFVMKLSHRARMKRKLKELNSRFALTKDIYMEKPTSQPSGSQTHTTASSSSSSSISSLQPRAVYAQRSAPSLRANTILNRSSTMSPKRSIRRGIRRASTAPAKSEFMLSNAVYPTETEPLSSETTIQNVTPNPENHDEDDAPISLAVESLYNTIYKAQQKKEVFYAQQNSSALAPIPRTKVRQKIVYSDLPEVESVSTAESVYTDAESSLDASQWDLDASRSRNLKLSFDLPSSNQFSDYAAGIKISGVTRTGSRRRRVIKRLTPNPAEDSTGGEDLVEEDHEKIVERLKKRAHHSRARMAQELEGVENRLRIKKILALFEMGEILKLEKMLVLVKEVESAHSVITLTDDEHCDTRVLERWKEYIVVVRSNSDPDNPVSVQFKKKRHIGEKEDDEMEGLDFQMNLYHTKVDFYSTLDKTISIKVPGAKGDECTVYILRTHTASSAIEWYKFFKEILSPTFKTSFPLEIPELDMRVRVHFPFEDFDDDEEDEDKPKNAFLKVTYNEVGYVIEKPKEFRYIIDAVDQKLASSDSFKNQEIIWKAIKNKVVLSLRSFDRLEWPPRLDQIKMSDLSALSRTHILELRKNFFYPRSVEQETSRSLCEPVPIEGFLVRLSSHAGRQRSGSLKRRVFKLEYYYTHDNLLMFCTGHNGVPPLPDTNIIGLDGTVQNTKVLRENLAKLPGVYYNSRYQLDEYEHFEWLRPGMYAEEFRKNDLAAQYELERRSLQIVGSRGLFDLCEIQDVVSIPFKDVPKIVRTASKYIWNGAITEEDDAEFLDACFEIRLASGGSVKLQAPSRFIKEEWMQRIKDLSIYWKARKAADRNNLIRLKEENQKRLNITDSEAVKTSAKFNWEWLLASANPAIYNISDIAITKCLHMSGILYMKPKKHSNFKRYFALLSPGNLTIFEMFRRGLNGVIKKTCGFRHYMTIAVHDAYVYSGTNSALDLLDKDSGIEHAFPTDLSEPRIYSDGWYSSERQKDRCFTLWFGTKRAIAGNAQESSRIKNNAAAFGGKDEKSTSINTSYFKMVSRLGVTGKSMVFVTRSREERDLWVSRLSNSIEKFFVPEKDEVHVS